MEIVKTLTVEGKTYQLCDPEAARIDDGAVGADAWSAKKLIDTLCPAFTAEGQPAVCNPVEGYPLCVTTKIQPVQSGTPAPQNPCPITGHTEITLALTNGTDSREQTASLGQTVYYGEYDWDTGLLTVTYKMLTLTGTENVWKASVTDIYTTTLISDHVANSQSITGICSHVPQSPQDSVRIDSGYLTHANAAIGGLSFNKLVANWGLLECSVEAWKAFLAEQYAAGTPVQILYKLKNPVTVQLDPETVTALAGENSLQANTGAVVVTGRQDLRSLLPALGIQ